MLLKIMFNDFRNEKILFELIFPSKVESATDPVARFIRERILFGSSATPSLRMQVEH